MSHQALWVRGALFLSIAGFISKVLGMAYRVPLQNIAGDEGLYIYQQVYPILSIAIILSVYSLPSAISHIAVNDHKSNVVRIPHVGMLFMILFGAGMVFYIAIFLSADLLAAWMGDPELSRAIKVAGGMFLLIPVTALFRGLFQSLSLSHIVAASQIIEQFFRVIGIIGATIFVVYVGSGSLYAIGSYTAWATNGGTVVASFVLLWLYNRNAHRFSRSRLNLNKRVIQSLFIGMAIYSVNYMLHLVLQLVDVFTLVELLESYAYPFEEAKVEKGVFDRSHSLIQLGLVLGSSLALALIPEVHQNHMKQGLAFKWTFVLSLSASVGLIAVMPYLNPLLFKTNDGILSIQLMMLLIFLLSMTVVVSVFLQAYDYRVKQVKWILLMVGLKYGLNLLLIPTFGLMGASVAYIGAVGLLLAILLRKWKTITKIKISYGFIIRSLTLISVMGIVVYGMQSLFNVSERLLMFPIVIVLCLLGVVMIIMGLWFLNIFTKKEWEHVLGKHRERGSS